MKAPGGRGLQPRCAAPLVSMWVNKALLCSPVTAETLSWQANVHQCFDGSPAAWLSKVSCWTGADKLIKGPKSSINTSTMQLMRCYAAKMLVLARLLHWRTRTYTTDICHFFVQASVADRQYDSYAEGSVGRDSRAGPSGSERDMYAPIHTIHCAWLVP